MSGKTMETVRDRLWVWGHIAGSHDEGWELPMPSRMTPAEAALYLDVPNLLMVSFRDNLQAPFDQLATSLRPLDRVVWSIVGAGAVTDASQTEEVFKLAERFPNITGVIMDDFFKTNPEGGEVGTLSVEELQRIRRDKLMLSDRQLELWNVMYTHQFHLDVRAHMAECDVVTCWTWRAEELAELEKSMDKFEEAAPDSRLLLGCYLWDFGDRKPIPLELMKYQCEKGLEWLKSGRIEGLIFLASCQCDLGLETVEWTRDWIAEVGGERV